MMKKTKFYYELLEAENDEVALIKVIDRIMPLIDKYSKNKFGQIDEDLKSTLIEHIIKIIRTKGFAQRLLKN